MLTHIGSSITRETVFLEAKVTNISLCFALVLFLWLTMGIWCMVNYGNLMFSQVPRKESSCVIPGCVSLATLHRKTKIGDVSFCWLDYLVISQIMPDLLTGEGGGASQPSLKYKLRIRGTILGLHLSRSFCLISLWLTLILQHLLIHLFTLMGPAFFWATTRTCEPVTLGASLGDLHQGFFPPAAVLCCWCSKRLFSIFCFKSYLGSLAFLKPKLFLWFAGLLNALSVI